MARDKVDAHARTRKAGLTPERLKELLHYDPKTGLFTWLVDRGAHRCKGQHPGTPDATGYLMIRVDYVIYKAHRLAWLYMTGEWPSIYVDHINGVRSDNRWANLRSADPAQNTINSKQRSNRFGYRGIARSSKNSFRAEIRIEGRRVYLGNFATPEAASAAFEEAAAAHNGAYRKPPPK